MIDRERRDSVGEQFRKNSCLPNQLRSKVDSKEQRDLTSLNFLLAKKVNIQYDYQCTDTQRPMKNLFLLDDRQSNKIFKGVS